MVRRLRVEASLDFLKGSSFSLMETVVLSLFRRLILVLRAWDRLLDSGVEVLSVCEPLFYLLCRSLWRGRVSLGFFCFLVRLISSSCVVIRSECSLLTCSLECWGWKISSNILCLVLQGRIPLIVGEWSMVLSPFGFALLKL